MAVDQELSATLERVAAAFEAVAVPWAIGGSFASTLYGEPRATSGQEHGEAEREDEPTGRSLDMMAST